MSLPPELAALTGSTAGAAADEAAPEGHPLALIGDWTLTVDHLGGRRYARWSALRDPEVDAILSRLTLEPTGRRVRVDEVAYTIGCRDGVVFATRSGARFGVRCSW